MAWCPSPVALRPDPTPDPNQVVVTVLLVSLSLTAAFLFPNIDQLFGLLGGTTARPKRPGSLPPMPQTRGVLRNRGGTCRQNINRSTAVYDYVVQLCTLGTVYTI